MPKSSRAVLDASASNVRSYDQLVHAIREVQHASETRIETAVEQEKVREAWETGKLIQEHILLNKDRAEYGAQVVKRLSVDLGISYTELKYMIQFAKTYPKGRTSGQLTWGHIETLLSVNDDKEREEIAAEAESQKWPLDTLRGQIKKRKLKSTLSSPAEPELQEIKPGKPGVYRVLEMEDGNYYDLGFSIYIKTDKKTGKSNPDKTDLYTYNAQVLNVYDGDTFHARIDLGFGIKMDQRVRLLRVDAPEIESAEGKQAKALLQKILARDKNRILLQTFEMDQHGRPLANVWVCDARSHQTASADGTQTTRDECKGKAIEQELLDSGVFSVREQA